MSRNRQIVAVALILLAAAALRFTALNWDAYEHYHPDERYISWVATTIEVPDGLRGAFSPHTSSFNPFYWSPDAASEGIVVPQDEPRSFAYGHLPLYLGVLATRVVEWIGPTLANLTPENWPLSRDLLNGGDYIEYRHLTAVSRALTALFDTGTVLFVFLLGRRLFGPVVGLVSATFLAINVMHLQLARFYTVDPYLSFFTVVAVYHSAGIAEATSRRLVQRNLVLAAVAVGMAVGAKFSAVLLIVPLAAGIWLWRIDDDVLPKYRTLTVAVLLSIVVFAVTNPFAILDWSCDVMTPRVQIGVVTIPAFDLGSCYLDNVLRQSAMVRGDAGFDFTRQYVGTWPYIYPLLMQLRWGMGYLLGVPAITGFIWAIARGARTVRAWRSAQRNTVHHEPLAGRGEVVVLSWTIVYFAVTGAFFAKFMRYMQPFTPFLMIYAAALLWLILRERWRVVGVGMVTVLTAIYAVAFMSMYQDEHPWNDASRWIYENVPPGARFTSEFWDDPLPSSIDVEGTSYSRHIYEYGEVNWLTGTGPADDEAKLKLNLSRIAQADYLVLASNRGYGVVTRLEHLYPLSNQYYQKLFAGELGFDVVLVTGRSPRLGAYNIWPNRFDGTGLHLQRPITDFLESHADFSPGKADESFTVYDQPMAIILFNRGQFTVDEMLRPFGLP